MKSLLITSDIGVAAYLLSHHFRVLRLQADPNNPRNVQIVFADEDEAATRARCDYQDGAVAQAGRLIDSYKNLKSMVVNFRDNMRGAR